MINRGCNEDHLGHVYGSVIDMCYAYGITENTYRRRLAKGLTKEEALTWPKQKRYSKGRREAERER